MANGVKTNDPKKNSLFGKIESGQDALKTVRGASSAFFIAAGIQALMGLLLFPAALADAVLLAALAGVLMKWRSRAAAVLLLLVSGGQAAMTVLNRIGVTSQGGKNVFLAVIMFVAAVRAVEATFKLHGRYRQELARAA